MPELPEVETMVRKFRSRLAGRRIVGFQSRWKKHVAPSFAAARRGLVGRTIVRVGRRAKYITWQLDDDSWFLIHLRMSGRLEWGPDYTHEPEYVRAFWELDDNDRLLFCDSRKFGRLTHTTDLAAATTGLGVEPLSRRFTPALLYALLHRRARQLKPLLLDQSVVAGLGNIYTDEALFAAGLHPLGNSRDLTQEDAVRLHEAIRGVLRKAIRNHGTSIDWMYPGGWMQNHLSVYGRAGESCRQCGGVIVRLVVGQRGTHVCPSCQPTRSRVAVRRRTG